MPIVLTGEDIKGVMTFLEDLKCKELFTKLFKKGRQKGGLGERERLYHLATLFHNVQEFLVFSGQSDEARRLQSSQLWRRVSETLSCQVDDADFSFTSLGEDEFYPTGSNNSKEASNASSSFPGFLAINDNDDDDDDDESFI